MYNPNKFVIIKIHVNGEEPLYKIFASWRGGYLSGDSWKLNSGNCKVEKEDDHYLVHGYSGSIYKLNKNSYGTYSYTNSVLSSYLAVSSEAVEIVMLSEEEAMEYLEEECKKSMPL
jgi:hypothetical protein